MRPDLMNPLVLAYLGDSVFEVYVREYLILEKQIVKTDLLQKEAVHFVSAKAHASFMKKALENNWLHEEEIRIYKRGRNTKDKRSLKNTSVRVHNQSTGFETLIGHLYLLNDEKRIQEIFDLFKEFVEKELKE